MVTKQIELLFGTTREILQEDKINANPEQFRVPSCSGGEHKQLSTCGALLASDTANSWNCWLPRAPTGKSAPSWLLH